MQVSAIKPKAKKVKLNLSDSVSDISIDTPLVNPCKRSKTAVKVRLPLYH